MSTSSQSARTVQAKPGLIFTCRQKLQSRCTSTSVESACCRYIGGSFDLALHACGEPIERTLSAASARGVEVITPKPGESVSAAPPYTNVTWWRALRSAAIRPKPFSFRFIKNWACSRSASIATHASTPMDPGYRGSKKLRRSSRDS